MTARPRIVHLGKFYPPHEGGVETHLRDLCRGIADFAEVEVLVSHTERRTAVETVDGVRVTRLGRYGGYESTSICPELPLRIRAARPDLIHLHWPNPMALFGLLVSGCNAPLVVTYHSDIVRQKTAARLMSPFLHRCLGRSRAIIATSPNYMSSSAVLRRYTGRCEVIPICLPFGSLEGAREAAVLNLRRRYGERIVLAVGRHVYYKGFEYLIRAMQHVGGRLLLVGDGPLRLRLQNLADKLGIRERVVFLGRVSDDDLRACYGACEVFVLPSVERSEAFGIVQLEAMAAGKPVINTRLESGVPFVSRHGITGLTVPPRDADALARAMNHLLSDEALRTAYGRAGRQRVMEVFSPEAMAQRTLRVYESALGLATAFRPGLSHPEAAVPVERARVAGRAG